ncbi:hypothetical protein [Rhizobium sp. CNPSo 3490]|uniref:hypothetical protein n=1 Tax=Rhizobium sp. CNPSo 3490 TaxID=3021407 RepID=UPI00254B9599|nr:hypothetical protein [Rhizobium sp. CNPSo 3490]MDK4731523.1 hypothetical protein [Rhizobium sp. CNPSo 3490]
MTVLCRPARIFAFLLAIAGCPNVHAQETAADVKAAILNDLAQREKVLAEETAKLRELYRERDVLDPDKRFDELGVEAKKLAVDAGKVAAKRASNGPISDPKKALDASKDAKGPFEQFKKTIDAETKVIDEADRQDSIGDDLVKQEAKVKKASAAVLSAKAAAAVPLQIIGAMAEAERIKLKRQQMGASRAAGEAAARHQSEVILKNIDRSPGLFRTDPSESDQQIQAPPAKTINTTIEQFPSVPVKPPPAAQPAPPPQPKVENKPL